MPLDGARFPYAENYFYWLEEFRDVEAEAGEESVLIHAGRQNELPGVGAGEGRRSPSRGPSEAVGPPQPRREHASSTMDMV